MLFSNLNNEIKKNLSYLINSGLGYIVGYIISVILFWGKLKFSTLLQSRSVFGAAIMVALWVFVEELLFRRGFFALSKLLNLSKIWFVVASSLIFALCHLPQNLGKGLGFGMVFGIEVSCFLVGVYFALLFLKNTSLILPCFIHLLNNIFSSALFSLDVKNVSGFAIIGAVVIEFGISYYFYKKEFIKVK